jgi:hypothetical protein
MNFKRWCAGGIGAGAAAYATYVGVTWFRFGNHKKSKGESDAVLDIFMPRYDVVERHSIRVSAPAEVTLRAAADADLESPIIRAIFKGREWILRGEPDRTVRPAGFVAKAKSIGWALLAELPGREIVLGAVTKPWEANPVFRTLGPTEFVQFNEPDYVKIVFTLRADPRQDGGSVFRTETRAVATDSGAVQKFRWYWVFLSPGIKAIRKAMLPAVKLQAERQARQAAA